MFHGLLISFNAIAMRRNFLLLISVLIISSTLKAQIVFTEINYNSIGNEDGEYVELYNNSGGAIEMEGYRFTEGFEFIFPAYTFPANSYLVLAANPERIMETYGVNALQWTDGQLPNSGEIELVDNSNFQIDYVMYGGFGNGWTNLASALGFSLELCDVNSDNTLASNWMASSTFQKKYGHRSIYGTPGAENVCLTDPAITFSLHNVSVIEGLAPDTSSFVVYLINENGNPSNATIELNPASTADFDDFTIISQDIQFDGVDELSMSVRYIIHEDTNPESNETIILDLIAGNNVETTLQDKITIVIYDDDSTPKENLVLAGVFDIGATEDYENYGVELFAINDIPDLSNYSLGTANNGGGTDGIEIPLPSISLERGDSYFICDSKSRFKRFFGVDADLEHPAMFISGNDAIELFEQGQVIDTYGAIDVNGIGENWEYSDGWAVRNPNTGPDGATFNIDNWTLSGVEQLQGCVNEECPSPYPFNFYMVSSTTNLYKTLDFELLPTLVQNELFVNINEVLHEDGELGIYNSLGQLLFHSFISRSQLQIEIDLANIENGQYYLHLSSGDSSGTKKFIKH